VSKLNSYLYRILTVLTSGYTLAVLLLFFSVADQALGHEGLLPTSPTSLCLILIAPFGVVLLIQHSAKPAAPGPLRVIAENSAALAPFAIVALIAVALSALPGAYWDEGAKWILLIPYGLSITISATFLGRYRLGQSLLPVAVLLSNILLALSIWYDTIYPGTFAPITNRAAGFPGNANFAALVSVMVSSGGLYFGNPDPIASRSKSGSLVMNLLILVTTFAIVSMTMSRSGLINFSLLAALFLFYRLSNSAVSPQARALEALILCIGAIAALSFIVTFSQISATTQGNSRLTRFLNNQQVDDGSAGTRLAAVKEGLNLIESAPLLGHGSGFARTMSELPHNIYIQQWVNNGLLGLLGYLGFLLSALLTFIWRGCRNGVALIAVATIGGVFSHNILDQRPFLIMLGLLLGGSTGTGRRNG
jgi:O-antigen ligase